MRGFKLCKDDLAESYNRKDMSQNKRNNIGFAWYILLLNLNSTIKNYAHTYPQRYHNQMMKHQKKSLLGPENKGLRTDQFCPVITEKRAVEKLKLMFKDVWMNWSNGISGGNLVKVLVGQLNQGKKLSLALLIGDSPSR